jgi:hypothetical protein
MRSSSNIIHQYYSNITSKVKHVNTHEKFHTAIKRKLTKIYLSAQQKYSVSYDNKISNSHTHTHTNTLNHLIVAPIVI